MSFKKDSVADAVQSILHKEGTDVNSRTKDDIEGRKKTTQKDDVGPGADGKSTKAKVTEALGEPLEKVLADTAPHSGIIKTVTGTQLHDANRDRANKEKLRMKESVTLKGFKQRYEEHSIFEQMVQEVLSKDASAGEWIHDFVHSDNPKFAGKSKAERKKQALAAYYAKQRNEETEQVEEGVMDTVKKVAKKAAEVLGGPDDEGHKKDLQRKMGIPQTGKPSMAKQNEEVEQIDELKKSTVKSYLLKKHDKMYDNPAKDPKTARKDLDNLTGAHQRLVGVKPTSEEAVQEGWDDMLKDVKSKKGPQPNGGSGKKQGSAYGGSKQKDKPEHDEDKKVNEGKEEDVPFDPPFSKKPSETTDKSGAKHTPMSRAHHLARLAMGRVKKDLGQKKAK